MGGGALFSYCILVEGFILNANLSQTVLGESRLLVGVFPPNLQVDISCLFVAFFKIGDETKKETSKICGERKQMCTGFYPVLQGTCWFVGVYSA